MSVLALKAIGYGAEQIPDKFFEKIPGGYFTPEEKKTIKDDRDRKDRERHKSEQRSSKRSSRQNRSPSTGHSDDSAYDEIDDERERDQRKNHRSRRAKSVERSSSRSMSGGRNDRHGRDLDGEYNDHRDMAQAEQGSPYFPPPPTSDYRPYNPQDYASEPAQGEHRPLSAGQPYGYPPQPAAAQAYSTQPVPRDGYSPPYSPSMGASQSRSSASAAKYTPGPGYAPSPINANAYIPPPPIVSNSPYAPYNPADYPPNTRSNAYAPPPAFNRQRSNSQPSHAAGSASTYIPPSADQRMTAYDSNNQPPSRRSSTKHRREHRHRARSADTHSSSRKDHGSRRDSSRMTKVRERFDSMDLREKGLAATVGGVAAGALSGKAIVDKRSKSRGAHRSRSQSRSRSRHRHDDRARSRDRSHERKSSRGIRARSKSIIDRFRSKSRGPEDRDSRKDRYDRPDHGYERGRDDEYDYFNSESEGDGSPVRTRRHRRR